jgi:TATA-box binding protein (TBP) (component of TFIID and TFIIIB)
MSSGSRRSKSSSGSSKSKSSSVPKTVTKTKTTAIKSPMLSVDDSEIAGNDDWREFVEELTKQKASKGNGPKAQADVTSPPRILQETDPQVAGTVILQQGEIPTSVEGANDTVIHTGGTPIVMNQAVSEFSGALHVTNIMGKINIAPVENGVRMQIDIDKIHLWLRDADVHRGNVRTKIGGTTVMLSKKGNLLVMGAKDLKQLNEAGRFFVHALNGSLLPQVHEVGWPGVDNVLEDMTIVNCVAYYKFDFKIDLVSLAQNVYYTQLGRLFDVDEEDEEDGKKKKLNRGKKNLVVKPFEGSNITAIIYASGMVYLTGSPAVRDLEIALSNLYPTLKEYTDKSQ